VALFILCLGILGLSLSGTQTVADMQYKIPFLNSFFVRFRKSSRKGPYDINGTSYKVVAEEDNVLLQQAFEQKDAFTFFCMLIRSF